MTLFFERYDTLQRAASKLNWTRLRIMGIKAAVHNCGFASADIDAIYKMCDKALETNQKAYNKFKESKNEQKPHTS